MNTEKMIPIDFPRNITPYVPGDVYYNNFVDAEFTMDQRDADEFNNADPKGEFNTYFIVSFADRPNTTGKQPVDDDVVVDMSKTLGGPRAASELRWARIGIIPSWKPNHAALLAKFKEQGANTMYTGKKAEEATHIIGLYFKKIIPGNMPEFLSNDGVWMLSSFSVESALNHKSLIELSRPIGEREEDHTIDGILTKAQPQGAKAYEVALMIEALDDNPDEQVIEPWVGDHLKGLINPVSEGCQAGDVISVPYSELPPCNGEIPKPVFTQETADNNEMPPAEQYTINNISIKQIFTQKMLEDGVRPPAGCLAIHIDEMNEVDILYSSLSFIIFKGEDGKEWNGGQDSFLPIDNRTDKERAAADILAHFGWEEYDVDLLLDIIKGKEIHGVKWIIE